MEYTHRGDINSLISSVYKNGALTIKIPTIRELFCKYPNGLSDFKSIYIKHFFNLFKGREVDREFYKDLLERILNSKALPIETKYMIDVNVPRICKRRGIYSDQVRLDRFGYENYKTGVDIILTPKRKKLFKAKNFNVVMCEENDEPELYLIKISSHLRQATSDSMLSFMCKNSSDIYFKFALHLIHSRCSFNGFFIPLDNTDVVTTENVQEIRISKNYDLNPFLLSILDYLYFQKKISIKYGRESLY